MNSLVSIADTHHPMVVTAAGWRASYCFLEFFAVLEEVS
jgi:hypothetical protein